MTTMTLPAYAKINLYLAVTGRYENGYHAVETVMQAISLHDLVTVEAGSDTAPPIALSCSAPYVPCDTWDHLTVHLKMVKVVNFMLCVFCHN